ncbi:hypothetical protein FE257_000160 [Aspergillus nanangensis]|uniref:DUF7580 domain-containing protein n=1 Tax=Aspergillus nanangensis TaxID=2582783 RepID=A0AAD4H113_ASPNN|nr:hypothetical protein FE257_000160 [Aspergillus nanangensis]
MLARLARVAPSSFHSFHASRLDLNEGEAMAGIEIAGVVLAVLPLIINQVDNYAQGLETLRLFRKQRYRREVNDYLIRLTTQQTLLTHTIKDLLGDAVQYENDLTRLMMDPEGPLWQSEALEKEVKDRLKDDYDIFIANMFNLLELLRSLRQKLGLSSSDPQRKPASLAATNNLDMDFRKFKLIFSKTIYQDLLNRMEAVNGHLRMLLELADQRQTSRKKRIVDSTLVRYCTARKSARSLYNALFLGGCWKCACRDQHTVYIRLDSDGSQNKNKNSNKAPRFHVVLDSAKTTQWRFMEVECIYTPPSEPDSGFGPHLVPMKSSKKVAFKIENPGPTSAGNIPEEPTLPQIIDMCSSLASLSVQNASHHPLGLLIDKTQATAQHKVYVTNPMSRGEGFRSLKDLLAARQSPSLVYGQNPFSRRERLRLAANLASNVLVFHGSWLKSDWMTDDILVPSAASLQLRSPFIPLPLTLLGADIPAPSSSPNALIQNEILFPLGLALTELSLCRTLEDLRIAADQDQISTTTHFKTVSRCLQSVYDESGLRYGDAVQKCLFWSETREIDMDSIEFQGIVFHAIVKPLLEELQAWER